MLFLPFILSSVCYLFFQRQDNSPFIRKLTAMISTYIISLRLSLPLYTEESCGLHAYSPSIRIFVCVRHYDRCTLLGARCTPLTSSVSVLIRVFNVYRSPCVHRSRYSGIDVKRIDPRLSSWS